jgi:uncharacterized RDD family membrane protein YckC
MVLGETASAAPAPEPTGPRPAREGPGVVLGIDNVALDLPLAGAGSRSLAAFLDYLVVGILSMLWLVLGGLAAAWLRVGFGWIVALILLGLFLIDYGYFASVEVTTQGRTFGKWATGLAVVTRTGGRPGTGALLVRNAVRTVDLVVGVPLMAVDPLARRLGDWLAGTLVVHLGTDAEAPEGRIERIPRGWSGREVGVLESFLRRVRELEPDRAERMAQRLIERIERDDPALLDGVGQESGAVRTLEEAVQAGAR